MNTTTLTPEEVQILKDERIVFEHASSGKLNVSRAFLFGSSTATTEALPTSICSAEALEYIGLEPQTALHVYQNWSTRPNPGQNPDGLLDYAYRHTAQFSSASFERFTDAEAMTRIGIKERIRDVITDPRFAGICGTESLQYWVDDTLRINYFALEGFLRRLKSRAGEVLAERSEESTGIESEESERENSE